MTNAVTFAIIVAAIFLIGVGIGTLVTYREITKRPDGLFMVNLHDVNEEMFKMQIDIPLEDIPEAKLLIFKVVKSR